MKALQDGGVFVRYQNGGSFWTPTGEGDFQSTTDNSFGTARLC